MGVEPTNTYLVDGHCDSGCSEENLRIISNHTETLRALSNRIFELEKERKSIQKQLILSSNFRAQCKVAAIIALAIFSSSFVFTQVHVSKFERLFETITQNQQHDHEALLILQGEQKVDNQKYLAVIKELNRTNDSVNETNRTIKELIKKL